MLSGNQIREKGLIQAEFDVKCLRGASYDLRIDTFYRSGPESSGTPAANEVWIEPQGILGVISKEIIALPHDICAHATVKNSLSVEGILAINIGVIDPGWEGPVSSILLNFGKNQHRLNKGDVFLRLSFHEVSEAPALARKPTSREEYIKNARGKFDCYLSNSFMDFEKAAKAGSEKFANDLKSTLLKYVPIATVALAIVTFFLNYGVLMIASRAMPADEVQLRAEALVRTQTADLRKQIESLTAEIAQLRQQSTASKGAKK